MESLPLSGKLKKVLAKYLKDLEKKLSVKIIAEKNNVILTGEAYAEYIGAKVLHAIDLSFDMESALLLLDQDYMLEVINLKNYVRVSRLKTVKGRIIGKKGKAKKVIAELTECSIVIKDNAIALIGKTDDIALATKAILSLIRGSPHASIYTFLEKNKAVKQREIY